MKGTPVHVKAALNYNDMLRHHKIKTIRGMINGEKIKWHKSNKIKETFFMQS